MRRTLSTLAACFVALFILTAASATAPSPAGAAGNPEESITCDDVGAYTGRLYRTLFGRQPDNGGLGYWVGEQRRGLNGEQVAYWMTQGLEYQNRYGSLDDTQFVNSIYENLLGRPADPSGLVYWRSLIPGEGRHSVVSWMTQTPEYAIVWPYVTSPICDTAARFGLAEVRPGIVVGRSGTTVTVVADRDLVDYRARDGGRTFASSIAGDIVVNANWFSGGGSQAPVVVDGVVSGSGDTLERGQLVLYRPGPACDGPTLAHVWTWEIFTPGPCVQTAVSGVSLVHQGVRADAFPGINLTSGYTNTSSAHSFIGYDADAIVIVSTRQMNASALADYALSLGVTEGIMLDGGGSTQIDTPTARLTSSRAVPAFAILDSRYG